MMNASQVKVCLHVTGREAAVADAAAAVRAVRQAGHTACNRHGRREAPAASSSSTMLVWPRRAAM
jgi:hypothetical protein